MWVGFFSNRFFCELLIYYSARSKVCFIYLLKLYR